MSQPGKQTTLIYGSLTAGTTPQAANLVTNLSGVELAINAADGRLFFKDTQGIVRVLADMNLLGASGVANINGGHINGAAIGDTNPSTGNFTVVTANSLKLPNLVGMLKSNGSAGVSVAVPGSDYVSGAMVGNPNGVASLGADGKVPLSQLPDSATGNLVYLGTWDASTNQPTLSSGVGVKGQFYKVNVAGTTNIDGEAVWAVGDQIVFNGVKWERIAESSAPVTSVNGMIGAVVITKEGLNAASAGANYDITSLNGLTSPLSVSQGGTGGTTFSGLVKANGNHPMTSAVAGVDYAVPTTGSSTQLLGPNGSGGFTNITLGTGLSLSSGVLSSTASGSGGGTVTSVDVSGGATGLSFSGGPVVSTGTIIMNGKLNVANGGTGSTSLSGILKGNGTSAVTSATAGVDYAVPTNGAASQLLANNGSGGFSNITLGTGLSLSGSVLSVSGGSGTGTVTSVAASGGTTGFAFSGSPITSSGTLTLSGKLNVSNGGTGATALYGMLKGNGTSAITTAVAGVDYALPPSGTNSQLLAGNGSGGFQVVTIGTGLTLSGSVLSASGGSSGSGTVTSVNASGGTTGLSFYGGPVTSSGTLTLSGTLAVTSGGTGATSLTGILKGNTTSAITSAIAGVDYLLPPTGSGIVASTGAGTLTPIIIGSGLQFVGNVLSTTSTGGGTTTKTRIVVIGSSFTAQQPLYSRPWPALLQDNLNASGYPNIEIINLAINSWTYYRANTNTRFGGSKTMRDVAIELQPDILIMALGGFNDTVMAVDGRTLAQAKADFNEFVTVFRAGVPNAKMVFFGELTHDNVHGSPATLVNRQVMPCHWSMPASGIFAGCYSYPTRGNAVDSTIRARYADWVSFDSYARSNSNILVSDYLPVWKAIRLGMGGYDGLHYKEAGHYFVAAHVRKVFKTNATLLSWFPYMSNQETNYYDDPDTLFNGMLEDDGTEYVTKEDVHPYVLHAASYFGPWYAESSMVWMLPSKGSLVTSNRTLTSDKPFTWLIQNSMPHYQVYAQEASVNGGNWFAAHSRTDQQGNFLDTGLLTASAGSYTFYYKVGNEIYGPVPITVSAGSSSTSSKAYGYLKGLAGTVYNSTNGPTNANFSTSGAVMGNGCYAVAASGGFGTGIYIPTAGTYQISSTVLSTSANTGLCGIFTRVAVKRSGSSVDLCDGSSSLSSGYTGMALLSTTSFMRYLNAGDVVYTKVYSFNDTTQTDPNGSSFSLSVQQIS